MSSFHQNVLKIIKIDQPEAAIKYNIQPIEKLIDDTCFNLLTKILNESTHPVITKLLINPRSTSIVNKYKGKSEQYNNSFTLKYLRLMRDGSHDLYQNRSLKRLISIDQLNFNNSYQPNQLSKMPKTS